MELSEPDAGKKKAHDITIIRRASAETLRNGAAKGKKVLYVWDKACIDYHLWHKLKHSSGISFITREKSNSRDENCTLNLIDPTTDPRNAGIESDHLVGTSNGVQLRRIVYVDPADGSTYTYLTNEMTLPAYQLCLLYKKRWDIEPSGARWTGAHATCREAVRPEGSIKKFFISSKAKWKSANHGQAVRQRSAPTGNSNAWLIIY